MTATEAAGDRRTVVEIISAPAAFAGLREEWRELLQDSDSDGLFLSWEWLHAWWKALGARRKLLLLAVRAGPRLVAIAPFAVRPAAIWQTPPLRCIEMLGSGTAGSDHLDVIARRGWERAAAKALAESLTDVSEMLVLARIRSGASLAQELVAMLGARGFRVQQSNGGVCPFVPRPAGGFAAYLASLGHEHRYAYRRKLQALHKRYQVSFEVAGTELERRESLRILIELHQKRWQGRGRSEAFSSAALCSFHEEISGLALERGWLRLFVLRLDGQPVAALYGFRYGRVFSFYQSGFDPVWGKQSVGLVTMGLAIESAFTEGAEEFDMLHGDEAYKFHWAREVRELARIELYPPGTRGLVCQGVAALAKSARRAGRALLTPRPKEGAPRAA